MRIAVYHNLCSGGAKRVAYEHCRALVAAGHVVEVYEPAAEPGFCDVTEVASAVTHIHCPWREVPPSHGWRKLGVGLANCLLMPDGYRRLAAMQRKLAAQLDRGGYDLVYVHHDIYETAPSLLRFLKTPSVYYCQEPARGVFEAPLAETLPPPARGATVLQLLAKAVFSRPFAAINVRYRMLNERLNTLSATLVLANSYYSCESILRAHGRVARRCTLGVDTAFFTPGEAPREDFVLSVGGFWPQKGFRFVIRALGQVPSAVRPPLVLVGDRQHPAEVAYLEALAREQGVTLTTHLRVTDDLLRDLYRRARLFVYAPYLEPLGLTPLEAMACGAPVLGVREAGVRETVVDGSNGGLADHNEAQFAATLQEMLARPEELGRMGEWARRYVEEHWTWEKSLADLLGLFQETLGR
jgi:glycosyltransferase involved in cell wall biosynthesis